MEWCVKLQFFYLYNSIFVLSHSLSTFFYALNCLHPPHSYFPLVSLSQNLSHPPFSSIKATVIYISTCEINSVFPSFTLLYFVLSSFITWCLQCWPCYLLSVQVHIMSTLEDGHWTIDVWIHVINEG